MCTERNRVVGILAHVDAGKTTLSERILYETGAIRAAGTIMRGDTVMDVNPIERARGITIFADQSAFEHGGHRYTLIDTPGHVDFAAETERSLDALDAAILLADAAEGVRPHTVMLAGMAQRRGIPLILFLNKCDLPAADVPRSLEQARQRLNGTLLPLPADPEAVAECDETFLEQYLSGDFDEADVCAAVGRAFRSGVAIPVLSGSAQTGDGVEALLNALDLWTRPTEGDESAPAEARVYRVRRDAKGRRVTYVKVTQGTLRPRDAFVFGERTEKLFEIRQIRGERYEVADAATVGDAVGLIGLETPKCGDLLTGNTCRPDTRFELRPALAAGVCAENPTALMEKLRILEDEDRQLGVESRQETGEILVHVMGGIQLEVLEETLRTRFGIEARFSPPEVLYRETVAAPVMGYGHYEPLRHYAEVNLRLEPAPRGSGISFESECHVDLLALQYQNLIRTHVFERVHKGVLTGSPLTDVRIVLTAGRAHLKHTEGGDFREATYRAIRQGLMNAQSLLLEPFYRFEIIAPSKYAGRILSDIPALAGSFDPPETLGDDVRVTGRAPVSTFAPYAAELRAVTHGEGSAACVLEGDDLCHNADEVCAQRAYRAEADLSQPASSVFCAHGAGYTVPWNEAEALMHCR